MRWLETSYAMFEYVQRHANPSHDPVSEQLAAKSLERFGDLAGMNIGPDQGHLLAMLTKIRGITFAIEIGTFTGMSALWNAGALPDDGRDASTVALRAFNDNIAERDDIDAVMLPVGDGITLIHPR